MNEYEDNESQKTSHLLMVIMMITFSVLLLVLNLFLDWEKWTIPLIGAAIPAGLIMHIMRRPSASQRTNIYVVVLLAQMFYYVVHMETIYDASGVIVLVMVIFTTTNHRWLNWLTYLIATLALFIHIFQYKNEVGLTLEQSHIIRSMWVFLRLSTMASSITSLTMNSISRDLPHMGTYMKI